MPKLNVYVDDELAKRVRELRLPLSEISQKALWDAVEKDERAVCKKCKAPAVYHVRREGGSIYSCVDHIVLYLTDPCTVRPI
jgi:hypothetical protein